ncbi:cation diffusion facilitator family transporter [Lachnotalea sp. AF33-28]|uniref:cation diffusion facilitator family transporter n=1 Tax=Lachnotalea sp. AF33-28 TaxID=2292046 RepID=UPI000E54DC3E|nr:cation diffusion facilitator family transporter [Lachnotalea sp. AF33-28]RHP31294.1 cation transporter [Lachnotalea sp. AF33-28]
MKRKQKNMTDQQIAMRVSANSIAANVVLSAFKLFAGIAAHSGAMVSDAVHSASDVFSTVIVIIGFRISGKASDEKHPYGHERMECVASILLAVVLCATGAGIGLGGIENISRGSYTQLEVPGMLAMAAAVISIIVKEAMYWYTRYAARKINSTSLMADAWHHRSDALSSVGSLIGILGARLGFPVMDPLASVVICVFIIKASVDIFKDAVEKMTDESCDSQIVSGMRELVSSQDGVLGLDELKTRMFGSRIYVDIEISAYGGQTLDEAHRIAERVHDAVEGGYPRVKHCMVHVNPISEERTDTEE